MLPTSYGIQKIGSNVQYFFGVWAALDYLLAAVTPLALNLFPVRIMIIGLAVGLVEVLVATLVGAQLYREQTA